MATWHSATDNPGMEQASNALSNLGTAFLTAFTLLVFVAVVMDHCARYSSLKSKRNRHAPIEQAMKRERLG